jgi:hypothetical protein
MNKDKELLLKELEKRIEKIPDREKYKFLSKFFVGIISNLAKRLIKYEGYPATRTIIQREITEIGRRDAIEIMKKFKIKKKSPENVSKILKIAALLLGYKLEVIDGETYVKECPFAVLAKETGEPLITQICSWYCNGIAEEVLGKEFEWKGFHDIEKEIPECFFKAIKRE